MERPDVKSMVLRAGLAALAGLVAASVVMMVLQGLNHLLFPPPPGTRLSDPEDLAEFVRSLPAPAFLLLELSYVVGSATGGAVGARLMPSRKYEVAIFVGVVLTLLGFVNLASIPHPLWVAVLTSLTYVPGCLLGAWLARKRG